MTFATPLGSDVLPGIIEAAPETKAVSFADTPSEFFENLLDIINPLQHIPVVSTIYRAITGDEIAAPARLIGGALYGGPMGFASASANLFLEDITGDDLAGHALALIGELDDGPELADAAVPAAFAPLAEGPALDLAAPDDGTAPAPQAAANPTATDGGEEIIWNGPRVLPSLARAPAVRSGSLEPAQTSTADPLLDAQPAWLKAAIADAQSVQGAAQTGKAAQKVEAQPLDYRCHAGSPH